MSFETYRRWCYNEIVELSDQISLEDIQRVVASISAKGSGGIWQFLDQYGKEAAAFVRKSPSERDKVMQKIGQEDFATLSYAAILYLQTVLRMLETIDSDLVPGKSYRKFAGDAIQAWEKIVYPKLESDPRKFRIDPSSFLH